MASVKDKTPAARGPGAKSASKPALNQRELVEKAGKNFEAFIQGTRQQSERAIELHGRLRALGMEGLTTREQFRDAVRGANLTTEDGQKRFVELLALAEDFASLTPPIEEPPAQTSAAVDTSHTKEEDRPMNAPTREEIDAKLELIETRMDGRVASIERSVQASIDESRETRRDIKSLKWTILFTAVATVVALWGVNAAIFSNMVASFESGKNTAASQAEVKRQTEETAALIKRMQDQLDTRPPGSAKEAKPEEKK
jgi:hypothetical protein